MIPVNIDITLISMIEQKQLFLNLIDQSDEQGSLDAAFSLSDYEVALKRVIEQQTDTAERRKLHQRLQPSNLLNAGLAIDVDRFHNRLVLAEFVLTMFRHFDKSRLKALDNIEFEHLRQSYNQSWQALYPLLSQLKNDDDVANEVEPAINKQLHLLRKHLTSTLGQIKQNIDSLQSKADNLAQLVEHQDKLNVDAHRQAKIALQKISILYREHILPTLSFLQTDIEIKGSLSAMQALEQIKTALYEAGLQEAGYYVFIETNHLRSYYKDIEHIRKSLMRYVRQDKQQRHRYNRLEMYFNQLQQQVSDSQDGKLINNYITKRPETIFALQGFLGGLKRYSYEAKLSWHTDVHEHFYEYLRVRRLQISNQRKPTLPDALLLDDDNSNSNQQEAKAVAHQAAMVRLVRAFEPLANQDIYPQLHDYLSQQLSDYQLTDLLDATSLIIERLGQQDSYLDKHSGITFIYQKSLLSYQNKTLYYFPAYVS